MIEFEREIILQKIISGGQTGADQGGLFAARACGFETGGHAPKGFRTLVGDNLDLKRLFNLEEAAQRDYKPRTGLNVKNSDATFRLATNFNSPGEICTLNFIRKYQRPHFDINLNLVKNPEYCHEKINEAIDFLIEKQVIILNIAGNADRAPADGYGFHFYETSNFLASLFSKIKSKKEKNETILRPCS